MSVRDRTSALGPAEGATAVSRGRDRNHWKGVAGFAVVAVLAASPAFLGFGPYSLYLATLTLIYLLGAAGLNLILGYAGQISLAQGAFMGMGGYTVAILGVKLGWPLLASLPVGAFLGFALGILLGAPALRVRTHYLAMITLGVEVIYLLVAANEQWLTGGALGMEASLRPSIGPVDMTSDPAYHVFVVVVVALVLGALYFVLTSTWGRAFKSIRENEMRAQMLGVNVRAYKLLAFAIGCAMAAVAGGLLSPLIGFVDPDTFPLNLSFELLLMVIVGGRGRFEGPVFGALLVTLLPEVLRGAQSTYLIIFALLTLAVLMFMPRGLVSLWDRAYLLVLRRPAPELTK